MSPLACLAKSLGYQVQGSDSGYKTNKNRQLESMGIRVFPSHSKENLPGATCLIYSSAIPANNPELIYARKQGIPILHRSQLQAAFMKSKRGIAISGTHGKTTTTCLTGWLLDNLNQGPTMVSGSALMDQNRAWMKGTGPWFLAEADESDGSFLRYRPHISVITNIDQDHLDFYGSKKAIFGAFQTFSTHIRNGGHLIICTDTSECAAIFKGHKGEKISFGFSMGCTLRAHELRFQGEYTHFQLSSPFENQPLPVTLRLLGKHNVLNALSALSVIQAIGLPLKEAAALLPDFPGVDRRLSLLFKAKGLHIYDDYAHNPGKISACIHSIRVSSPGCFLIVVFQPHRFSRLRTMMSGFSKAFREVDQVCVLPVFSAGEPQDPQYNPHYIAEKIRTDSGCSALGIDSLKELALPQGSPSGRKTVILSVGAGDSSRMIKGFVNDLESSFEPDP